MTRRLEEWARDTSLIVVSYRDLDEVRLFLGRLQRLGEVVRGLEVIVAQNGASEAALRDQVVEPLELKATHSAVNRGYAAAFNSGRKLSDRAVQVSINSDTRPTAEVLHAIYRTITAPGPPLLAVAPTLFNETEIDHGRRFYSLASLVAARLPGSRLTSRLPSPGAADWALGACLAMHKNTWDALDGLDERFFLYFEDVDACWRLAEMGGRLEILKEQLWHDHGRASARLNRKLAYHVRSAAAFFRSHPRAVIGLGPREPLVSGPA